MKYVIIGNGTAGVAAIEGIRKHDKKGSITVVTDENRIAYGRPLISYYLGGVIPKDKLDYRPMEFYADNNVKLKTGKRVTAIDSAAHAVFVGSERLSYDRLLVATGSTPIVPEVEGAKTVKQSFTFLNLDDAERLKNALTPQSRLLIIGAGLIGLKCAEGAHAITQNITIIDLAPKILSSILDDEGASIMLGALTEAGVRVITGDRAVKYEGGVCTTEKGEKVEFDVLVTAVGVRPNVGLVREAGGEVNRGIVVDRHCRTSLPDVFAAGDCAEVTDLFGEKKVLALLPMAFAEGETAGEAMAGVDRSTEKLLPMNAIGFFGKHLLSAGIYDGEDIIRRDEGAYKRFFVKDNRLVGFIMIGGYDRAGILTSLIRDGVDLSETDFPALLDNPMLIALPPALRNERLHK